MESRINNSAKNLISKLGISIIMVMLGFVTRKVFVDNIGVEYLGLNGLLSNILGIMSLLEGGFATSVVYNMYKPLAEDDRPKILALLQLFRKVYIWIAIGISVFGICLYPFIGHFMKDGENLRYVGVVYFIFLFNSVINYFSAYKWSLINASQKVYKLTFINLFYQIGLSLSKLAILYYTKNYILFLIIESLFNIGYNIAVVYKANQLFPYIKTREHYFVDEKTKNNIITNIKALFINKIGGYFMHSTDNLIISSFVSVASVGLYSNYTLITGLAKSLVSQSLDSFSASVGNLIASESTEKVYSVFKTCFFINFILVSIPIIVFCNTLTPLVRWWLGADYLLGNFIVWMILFNFYIDSIRTTALTFKIKSGIFIQDRWTPFLQGVINVVLSLLFVKKWGIAGVLIATSISILSIGFWQFPNLCYKYIFKRGLWDYFRRLIVYSLVGILCIFFSHYICSKVQVKCLFLSIITKGLITISVIILMYWTAFHRTEQYKESLVYVRSLVPHRLSKR